MSYCPECGEQVAKEDVFCPFCGISLKPFAPVDDGSMSETIMDMPSIRINQEALDALTAKSKKEAPVVEAQSEFVAAKPEEIEPKEDAEKSVGFSAGNTSENWTMKTDSVDIPAEFLDESKSIPLPLPQVFGNDEPKTPAENIAEDSKPTEPENIAVEEPKVSEPVEETTESDRFSNAPTPAIIQDQGFNFNANQQPFDPQPLPVENEIAEDLENEPAEANPEFSEKNYETPASPFDQTEAKSTELIPAEEVKEPETIEPFTSIPVIDETESPEPTFDAPVVEQSNEAFSEVSEEKPEASDFPAPLAPTSSFNENLSENVFAPIGSAPIYEEPETPVLEEPKDVAAAPNWDSQKVWGEPNASEELKFEEHEIPPVENVAAEPEDNAEVEEQLQSEPEIVESPIAMPELPLVLENQDEETRFDSVQMFQKDENQELEVEASPVEAESVVSQKVEEPSVSEPQQETPKEGRSFTTPNIGNTDTDGRKSAKLKPLDEGVILNGRYEIVRKIGGGGMGAVYLANDRNLGGVLRAVKEMVQSYIESDQQDKAISDFKRESLLLTSLDHPAIPTIYDYFFDEKEARFYLVMKYISGGDLAGRLRAAPEGRVDEKSVTEWAIQIADVLSYLHTHEPSIVYRDLKPANVMIDGNSGRVMLIDFGIARWVNKEEKGVTAVGTMGYAPPELFSGNVEPRSDIYSLGSTMFHLLTGADPQSNPLLIFDFQKNPRPRQINSQLSDQIEKILMQSVEYNADARFMSAGDLRDALKEHLTNLQLGKVTYGVKAAPSSPTFSEQSVFCGFCGKQIVATDVFCAFCGAQQPIAQQNFSQPSLAVQPLTAKLLIVATGELEPSSFRLEKTENLLGRRDPMSNIFPEVDLSKYDPQTKISRRHARIWREGNSFLVEDLGSSNGTTLLPSMNDSIRLLPHQPHSLTNGDKIRLGDTTLHFTIG